MLSMVAGAVPVPVLKSLPLSGRLPLSVADAIVEA